MKILKCLIVCLIFWKFSLVCAETKVINFGTTNDYPPFEYVGATGTLQGFDIDVAKSLCARMQVTCKFTVLPFDSLIPSLKIGKIDAIIASLNYSPERAKEVDFTKFYHKNAAGLVAMKNSSYILALNNINGKIIGVQTGSVYDIYLKKNYGSKITIKYYEDIGEIFMDLINGRIDIVIGDLPAITQLIKSKPQSVGYQIVVINDLNEKTEESGSFIAVRKGNAETLSKINAAIDKTLLDGSLTKIEQKYFGQ